MEIGDYDAGRMENIEGIISQMKAAGFQASHLAEGIEIINRMRKEKATIYLTFTANMVATGLRGIIARLCEKKLVDVIITTGGSIDHDLIRSYKHYILGDFGMDDLELHKKGINRIGNVLVPNDRYVLLEEKIQPIFKKIHEKNNITNPSDLIHEIGMSLNDKKSFCHWASRNNIPIFSPGITDSAIGLQTYFFKVARRHGVSR